MCFASVLMASGPLGAPDVETQSLLPTRDLMKPDWIPLEQNCSKHTHTHTVLKFYSLASRGLGFKPAHSSRRQSRAPHCCIVGVLCKSRWAVADSWINGLLLQTRPGYDTSAGEGI